MLGEGGLGVVGMRMAPQATEAACSLQEGRWQKAAQGWVGWSGVEQ